jgi:DNA-binding beta-propeller fold protein YncE
MIAHRALDDQTCQVKSTKSKIALHDVDLAGKPVIHKGRSGDCTTPSSDKSIQGEAMKKQYVNILVMFLFAFLFAVNGTAQGNAPLKLIQTISMPGVQGRMDHITVDVGGKRLFIPANGDNQNTVEVIDLQAGKRIASIPGQSRPQGTFYSAEFHQLFVTNGTDGTCKIFDGGSFKLIDSLLIGSDANQVGYDPDTKYLYAGFGDRNSGALAIIDTSNDQHIADIKTDARPGGITFEKSGRRIFVNLNGATKLGVLDRQKREQIGAWPVTGAENYGPLALDESHHRLFLGSRKPPMLIVFDTETGKQITQLDSVPSIDGVWYDAARKRIYVTGNGFIAVYVQKGADEYALMVKIAIETDSQPSLWVPQFNRLYISVTQAGSRDAEVLVYEP